MFKKLLSLFEKIAAKDRKAFVYKVESFDDPVAKEIEWSSISKFSTGYLNRRLLKTSNGSIFFIPSIQALLFPLAFILMGSYVIWAFSMFKPTIQSILLHPVSTFQHYIHFFPRIIETDKIWGQLFGSVFFVIGLVHFYFSVRPIKFSIIDRSYSKGFWSKKKISFNKIQAIQIIYDTGNAESPNVYEMNLVLRNKERVFVFGHPKKAIVIEDATELSRMLSVPVWDIPLHSKERSVPMHQNKGALTKGIGSNICKIVVVIALLASVYFFVVGSPNIINKNTVRKTTSNTNELNLKSYRYKCVKITLKSGQALSGYVDSVNKSEYLLLQVIGGVVRLNAVQIASIDKLPQDNTQFDSVLSEKDLYRTLDQMRSGVVNLILLADYSIEEPNSYTSVIWTNHLKSAKRSARLLNKNIFVEFYLPDDEDFDRFHKDIFKDKAIKLLLDRNFVFVRIHGTEKDILRDFGVTQCPHLAFLDPTGNIILSTPGNMTISEFKDLVSRVLEER